MNPQDLKDLEQLIEFLKASQVAEFELERGDLKVRIEFAGKKAAPAADLSDLARLLAIAQQAPSRPPSSPVPTPIYAAPQPYAEPAPPPTQPPAAPAAPKASAHIVKSPIVGTYYGSPSPGSPAFVSVGDRVEKGQVVCIVEAMKLMNEIESDAAGTIEEILVTNGQPVEYGQPLFSIRV